MYQFSQVLGRTDLSGLPLKSIAKQRKLAQRRIEQVRGDIANFPRSSYCGFLPFVGFQRTQQVDQLSINPPQQLRAEYGSSPQISALHLPSPLIFHFQL